MFRGLDRLSAVAVHVSGYNFRNREPGGGITLSEPLRDLSRLSWACAPAFRATCQQCTGQEVEVPRLDRKATPAQVWPHGGSSITAFDRRAERIDAKIASLIVTGFVLDDRSEAHEEWVCSFGGQLTGHSDTPNVSYQQRPVRNTRLHQAQAALVGTFLIITRSFAEIINFPDFRRNWRNHAIGGYCQVPFQSMRISARLCRPAGSDHRPY